jgi:CRP-like cAMP-binding protein
MDNPIQHMVKDFFSKYPERRFSKGQLLLRPQETPAGVWYLVEGRVSQYDISSSGSEVVVNVFKPRAFFSMSWAINQTANQYFFEASTPVVVREAPAADAVAFLKANPDVTFELLSRVYRGADGLLRRMAHLMGGDARSRLVFELLNAAHRFGEPGDDGATVLPLSEGDLSKYSGLARETISRTLQKLKAEGLVRIENRCIVLPDLRALEAVLGADL